MFTHLLLYVVIKSIISVQSPRQAQHLHRNRSLNLEVLVKCYHLTMNQNTIGENGDFLS